MYKRYSWEQILLIFAMICIVSGSHLGMIWLANLYTQVGRLASVISPEPILGTFAIFSFTFVIIKNLKISKPSFAIISLGLFSLSAILGEVIRLNSLIPSTINSFFSLFINALIGFTFGQIVILNNFKIPCIRILIAIYFIWYSSLIYFYIRGDLGFYGILPGSTMRRLEFLSGFTATEIPVYLGFHVPVLMYCLILFKSKLIRAFSSILIILSLLLAIACSSSAVAIALILIVAIFYLTINKVNFQRLIPLLIMLSCFTILFVNSEIFSSSLLKIEDFQSGEGERSAVYGTLLDIILNEPLGIGRDQFYENYNLSWNGKGLYPHHNFLGIGAELGIVPLFFYICFVFSSIIVMAKSAFEKNSNKLPLELRLAISVGLSVLVFQQFRGLFHDTWIFKELYFWTGMGLGISVNAQRIGTQHIQKQVVSISNR